MADIEIRGPEDLKGVIANITRELGSARAEQTKMAAMVDDLRAALKDERQRAAEATQRSTPTASNFDRFIAKGDRQPVRLAEAPNKRGAGEPLPGLMTAPTIDDWHRDVKRWTEIRNFCRALPDKSRSTAKADAVLARLFTDEAPAVIRAALEPVRAATADESGFVAKIFNDSSAVGAEWIPDQHMPMLWETMVAERRVEALFDVVNMQDKNVIFPFATTGLRPYKKSQQTSDTLGSHVASTPATASRTLTAAGLAVRCIIDEDASEDSIIAADSVLRSMLATALVDGVEDAIVNGDTNSTHQDTIASWDIRSRWGSSGLGTSADHRRVWLGLRADAIDNSNTADKSGAQTFAGIQSLRGLLASPQGYSTDCVIITSPEWVLAKLSQLSEVVTLEKYGPSASIFTGEVAKIGGMPVIVTEFMGADLNASGVFDNSTVDYTGALVLNRRRWVMGVRRGITVEVQKDINSGAWNYVATVRKIFQKVDASSTKSVAYGYKLSKS